MLSLTLPLLCGSIDMGCVKEDIGDVNGVNSATPVPHMSMGQRTALLTLLTALPGLMCCNNSGNAGMMYPIWQWRQCRRD
jgi:hypothetical protein